jgi:3-deoxy-D-manno-octulosonic-acid transferase
MGRYAIPIADEGVAPLWIHAASLGEVRAAWPLLAGIKEQAPGVPIFLTTTSPEGREAAAGLGLADGVALFPLDLPGCVQRTLRTVRPRAVVILETELWPNFLRAARRADVPTILVNGRISDRSFPRYRRVGSVIARVLGDLRYAGMQSEKDLERIRALGAAEERSGVLGNLKYDALRMAAPEAPEALRSVAAVHGPVVIAGSTHPGEERIFAEVVQRLRKKWAGLRGVVAPRHVDRVPAVEAELTSLGLQVRRRSSLAPGAPPLGDNEILLLDTTGELAGAYAVADAAFVGGSLIPRGGHNPLEPLRHGLPVLFGPHTENFGDVVDAVMSTGGGFQVPDGAALERQIAEILSDPEAAKEQAEASRKSLVSRFGAVAPSLTLLRPLLKETVQ